MKIFGVLKILKFKGNTFIKHFQKQEKERTTMETKEEVFTIQQRVHR